MMILRGGDDNDGEQEEGDGDEEDLSNVPTFTWRPVEV